MLRHYYIERGSSQPGWGWHSVLIGMSEAQIWRLKNLKASLLGACPRQLQAGHGWLGVVFFLAEETARFRVEVVVIRNSQRGV